MDRVGAIARGEPCDHERQSSYLQMGRLVARSRRLGITWASRKAMNVKVSKMKIWRCVVFVGLNDICLSLGGNRLVGSREIWRLFDALL